MTKIVVGEIIILIDNGHLAPNAERDCSYRRLSEYLNSQGNSINLLSVQEKSNKYTGLGAQQEYTFLITYRC